MASGILEFTGLRDLEPLEQTIIKGIAQEYYPKVEREEHNIIDLIIHVKPYHKLGHKSKYSIHLKCIYATKTLNVDNVADWDLPKGVHEAFVALLNLLRHELKGGPSKYKARKSSHKSEKQIIRRAEQVRKSKKKSNVKKRAAKNKFKRI